MEDNSFLVLRKCSLKDLRMTGHGISNLLSNGLDFTMIGEKNYDCVDKC